MKSAEDLLNLIERKNLIASDLLANLRSRLTGLSAPVSADIFAQRLVEYEVLTKSLAEGLLRQLDRADTEKVSAAVPPSEPVIDLAEIDRPLPLPPLPPPQNVPVQPVYVPQPVPQQNPFVPPDKQYGEQNDEQLFRKKRFAVKKKTGNLWDTKLILFGGAGLFVLCLAGVFLSASLSRRSADATFAEADRLYESGSYSPAIAAYTEFLEKFPNHSESSAAKIRRSLARIRILVDAKNDWSKVLDAATEEIEAVKNEPKFFEESKAELAVLLPKIAAGLASEAEEKTSILHAEQAGKAITLIESVLPSSLRPAEALMEVQYKANRVRRILVQKDLLNETEKKLDALLTAEPFSRKEAEQCFELLDSVLNGNPELEQNSEFIALRQSVSEKEYRAVRLLSADELAKEIIQPAEEKRPVNETAVLYHRIFHKDTKQNQESFVFVYAAGTVFAVQSSDGTLRWQHFLGKETAGSVLPPVLISVPKTQKNAESVLVVHPQAQTLNRLDGKSGNPVWSLPIGEPFYCTEIVQHSSGFLFCIATHSGKVLTVHLDAAAEPFSCKISGWSIPQKISAAPMLDPENGFIYQPGEHDTLFVLPLEEGKKPLSHFTAHKSGSLRISPAKFGSHLLLVRQSTEKSCELQVFSAGESFALLQSFPVSGLTDTPPAADGSFLVLTSDSGETALFGLSGNTKAPLQKIASGSAGGNVGQYGIVRYAALTEKNVWIADRQLMRYEAQLAQSRLLPGESLCKDIITLAPLRKIGNVLFHTFRRPNAGGVFLQGIATDTASVCWEAELAAPPVLPPQLVDDQSLLIYTSGGKSYRIPREAPETISKFFDTPVTSLPPGGSPLLDVIPLKDGFAAWVTAALVPPQKEEGISNRTLMMYDPQASEQTRFRSLLLPSPFTAIPAALNGNLIAPLQNGRVALLDPKTGTPIADPFLPVVSADRSAFWSEPVCIEDTEQFLIFDNSPDEHNRTFLYRVALESGKLILKQKLQADFPVSRIAVNGNRAVFANRQNVLLHVLLDGGMKIENRIVLTSPCVWGPFAVNDSFLAATAQKIYAVSADERQTPVPSPVPVGQPLIEPDGVILVSATGTLWKYAPNEKKTLFTVETGVPTKVGPVRFGNQIVLSGANGIIYTLRKP